MTYVISYETKLVHKETDFRHCIYLDCSKNNTHWVGINSWGDNDPYPYIPFKGCEVRIYLISVKYLKDSDGIQPPIDLIELFRPICFKSEKFCQFMNELKKREPAIYVI